MKNLDGYLFFAFYFSCFSLECRPRGRHERVRLPGRHHDQEAGAAEAQGGVREEPERSQDHGQRVAVRRADAGQAGQVAGGFG